MIGYVVPIGWHERGTKPDDYWMGVDPSASRSGVLSVTLKSKIPEASGFGTLMQDIQAGKYCTRRIRFSGHLKGEQIAGWAGLWMRVDAKDQPGVCFDNMQGRAVTGTMDWARHDVVLDVPEGSTDISFGILLAGTGQVWASSLCFEVVGEEVPITDMINLKTVRVPRPRQPRNLSFEESI